jgi:hypothetical protein
MEINIFPQPKARERRVIMNDEKRKQEAPCFSWG